MLVCLPFQTVVLALRFCVMQCTQENQEQVFRNARGREEIKPSQEPKHKQLK